MANFTAVYLFEALAKSQINLTTDTLGMLMIDSTSDMTETHKFLSDVPTLGEITGAGYSRQTLTSVSVVVDTINKKVYMTANPVTWASINFSTSPAVAAVIYKDGAGDSSRLILARYEDGGFPIMGGTVPVEIHPHASDGFLLVKKGV